MKLYLLHVTITEDVLGHWVVISYVVHGDAETQVPTTYVAVIQMSFSVACV